MGNVGKANVIDRRCTVKRASNVGLRMVGGFSDLKISCVWMFFSSVQRISFIKHLLMCVYYYVASVYYNVKEC